MSRQRGKIVEEMVGVDHHKIKYLEAATAESRVQRIVSQFFQAHHSAEG